jgi:hypothetical protein
MRGQLRTRTHNAHVWRSMPICMHDSLLIVDLSTPAAACDSRIVVVTHHPESSSIVSSEIVGDGSAMLDVSSESASSTPMSPHVELMLQQLADRIAQLETANHGLKATVDDLKSAAIVRCTFGACQEAATHWCVDCAELCSTHALSVHTGSWSSHVHMSLDAKAEYQRKQYREKFAPKVNEIKEAMKQFSFEVTQLQWKLHDPAVLADHEAQLNCQ